MEVMRIFAVSVLALSLFSNVSFAHPPSAVTVKYDAAASTVSVNVSHQVRDEKEHFVYEIKLLKNGKQIVLQDFSIQTDKLKQTAVYTVPGLIKGDEITAVAYCNHVGTGSGKYTIQ